MLVFEKNGENFETTISEKQIPIGIICEIRAYKIQPYDIIIFIEQI
jgi:hypothetical protein